MCGISGVISTNSHKLRTILDLNNLIKHRGPDGEGFFSMSPERNIRIFYGEKKLNIKDHESYHPNENISDFLDTNSKISLGHRRLSIVDLSPLGHQPMSYAQSRYWITYNGEIYNHKEIRIELEKFGHTFSSHSDTEVILASYAQWGKECLDHFNGMFSFAIYDVLNETVFFARDRFGVKPFYYWTSPNGDFLFGSEIKQFTAHPEWEARVNPQRAYDFLVFGLTDHTDETMFKGVYQLPPGHYFECKISEIPNSFLEKNRIRTTSWYTLKEKVFTGSYDEACSDFETLFKDAVQIRLRADVPVGSCLSGGLDSSAIVCTIKNLLDEYQIETVQKTFSACSEVSRFDEKKWIDIVTEKTSVSSHYVYPKLEDLFKTTAEITWHQDEPFGSTSIYAQWHVFKEAKKNNVTVMLDGQGSDEHLAGYHSFFGPHLAGLFIKLKWFTLAREMVYLRKNHNYSFSRSIMYISASVLPEFIKEILKKNAGIEHAKPDWLNLDQLQASAINPMISNGAAGAKSVKELSIAQLTASNVQMLLHWEDRDSMAHSIESRVPFLDYRLVEMSLGLPNSFKISHGRTKRILRDALKNILPEQICNRMDKLGFVTPEEVWFKEDANKIFREKIKESIACTNGIFNEHALERLIDHISNGKTKFTFLPWRIISFGEWVKIFNVKV